MVVRFKRFLRRVVLLQRDRVSRIGRSRVANLDSDRFGLCHPFATTRENSCLGAPFLLRVDESGHPAIPRSATSSRTLE
jgi:hypothetical protein